MRAVLFATAIAGLPACGGDGDGAPGMIAAVPLAGTIDGQPWTFVAGQTDAFLSDGDTFFATLFDKPFAAPCDELQPQGATHSLILNIPKAVGRYALSLRLNQTFSYPKGGSTQNDIATSGTLEVIELTATSLSGGVKMSTGARNSVEGQFMITICAP
jgi:hypothetical protein